MAKAKEHMGTEKRKFFRPILKFSLMAALFLIVALMIGGAGIIVEDGALNISSDLLVDANTLFVNSSGNRVGIGTASPTGFLHVEGYATSTTPPLIKVKSTYAGGTGKLIEGQNYAGSSVFSVYNSGAILLGGNVISNGRWFSGDGSSDGIYINDSNSVGIGTSSPTHKLHVVGSENLTGTLYYGALQAQSPHAFINNDAKSRTEICLVADDGVVVLQYLKNVEGAYQWVFEPNAEACLNKEVTADVTIEYEDVYDETLGETVRVEKSRTEIKKKVFQQKK